MKVDRYIDKETYILIDSMCNFLEQVISECREGIDIFNIPDILAEQLNMLAPIIEQYGSIDDDPLSNPLGFSNMQGELTARLTRIVLELRNGRNYN